MSLHAHTAVEITKKGDSLDIWVDANNNGERDDDDVNIYVTAGGGFYTVSPTFKHALDTVIQNRIKQLAVMLLNEPHTDQAVENTLRDLALELVLKAQADGEVADAFRLQRPGHADLVKPQADLRGNFRRDAEFAQRLADVFVALARCHDTVAGVGRIHGDAVDLVGAREGDRVDEGARGRDPARHAEPLRVVRQRREHAIDQALDRRRGGLAGAWRSPHLWPVVLNTVADTPAPAPHQAGHTAQVRSAQTSSAAHTHT